MSPFEPRESFEHIDKLSYEIGPRLAGEERSRKSAEYIRNEFEDYGLETESQSFEFVDGLKHMKWRSLILIAAFLPAFFLSPLISLVVLLAGYFLAYELSRFLPKKESENVVGTLEPEGEVRDRVVLGAHYDSALASKGRKWTLIYRLLFLPVLSAFLALSIARFFIPELAWLLLWLVLAVPYLLVFVLPFWTYLDIGAPGANDNASGVSVLLESARVLSKSPPENTRIEFVAFGAEEQGLKGSKFFSEHSGDFDFLLNLDSIGAGDALAIVKGNGVLRKQRTSRDLNDKIGDEYGLERVWAPFSGHDHIPFLKDGFKATTLTSIDRLERNPLDQFLGNVFGLENVRTLRYPKLHSLDDMPDEIELENIKTSGNIVLSLFEFGKE